MFDPTTCADSPSAISSPESVCGPTRFVAPAGPMIDLFGPVPALANLSARQAKELRLMTSGTFGPPSTTSSPSAALQSSLENRLRARLSTIGSTLYKLTWKPWIMPSGRSRSRLRASVRRTSETETSGWPTPKAPDSRGDPYEQEEDCRRSELRIAAALAGWPTPDTTMMQAKAKPPVLGNRKPTDPQISLADVAYHLAAWTTPSASDSTRGGEITENMTGSSLAQQIQFAGWPTTSCNNDRTGNAESAMSMQRQDGSKVQQRLRDFAAITGPARLTVSGVMLTGLDAGMASGGQLNLDHSLWLMGCPPEWANSIPGRADWLKWQGLMQQVSSAPSLTGSSDCVVLGTPSMPKPQSPGSKR